MIQKLPFMNDHSTSSSNSPPSIQCKPSPSGGTAIHRISPTTWFTTEIQAMMYSLGDCQKPVPESASVIEDIVHRQMIALLLKACDVAMLRGSKSIGIEDIIFLLRKNKVKLQRLIQHLAVKDLKSAALKGTSLEGEDDLKSDVKSIAAGVKKNKRQICYEFLSSIDNTGELLELFVEDEFDAVKQSRNIRMDHMSRYMDSAQYLQFCLARQAGFTGRKYRINKFRDWLMQSIGDSLEVTPNALALDIIGYLAYETVAEIVDLSLIVKRDLAAQFSDPVSRNCPVSGPSHDAFSLQQGAPLVSPTSGSWPPSPGGNQSPPSSPTSPAMLSPGLTSTGSPGFTAKSRNKKRKGSGSHPALECQANSAILPGEIREAMRRFGEQVGPFSQFLRPYSVKPGSKLLCT
ncbi:PREDICTED: transcription initiation protein SPT3 homolog isoform X2 [Priapulus caudatus]|uniref:Transcription initiation protein SPT3 homolog isoform X2 n=1 Tax=Priapulus caudatus TaxID=37621 RepID=A0ABM1E839_PRICU|nr:PREDICTED: transcription initiation protein SPT3 homolog isoform X2 [Priapulus caudatus]